jgi:hypothetical protein
MATAEAFIIDPTAGMSLISTRGREREDTRYLFQAANLLDPERTQQLSYMASGGDEVATSCLRRTTNGYVPRARLTPLEVWNMSVPACHLPDGAQENTVRLVTAMTPETMGMNDAKPTGGPLNIYGAENQRVKTYPGDEIGGILKVYGPRGVVEVSALRKFEWWEDEGTSRPGAAQLLNRDFFPGTVPVQLSKVEELIDRSAGKSELHRHVAPDLHRSCQTARRFMQVELGVVHTLLKQRVSSGGLAYSYAPVHRSYLEQLEMQPQDVENSDAMMRIMAKFAEQGGGQGATTELVASIAAAVVRELTQQDEKPKNKGGRPPKAKEGDETE